MAPRKPEKEASLAASVAQIEDMTISEEDRLRATWYRALASSWRARRTRT